MVRPITRQGIPCAAILLCCISLTLAACQPQASTLTLEVKIADTILSLNERRLVKAGLRRLLEEISGRPVALADGLQRPDWWLHWQRQGTRVILTARLQDGHPVPHTIHLRESRQLRLAGVRQFLRTIHQGRLPDTGK